MSNKKSPGLLIFGICLGLACASPKKSVAAPCEPPAPHQEPLRLPFEGTEAFEYVARVSYSNPPRLGVPLREGLTYRVRVGPPNLLRLQVLSPDPLRLSILQYDNAPDFSDMISDGKTLVEIGRPGRQVYRSQTAPADLKRIAAATSIDGAAIRYLEMDRLLGQEIPRKFPDGWQEGKDVTLGRVYYLQNGADTLNERWELILNRKTNLPIRLSQFTRPLYGAWHERKRVEFLDWKLRPDFEKDTFKINIPAGYRSENQK